MDTALSFTSGGVYLIFVIVVEEGTPLFFVYLDNSGTKGSF